MMWCLRDTARVPMALISVRLYRESSYHRSMTIQFRDIVDILIHRCGDER